MATARWKVWTMWIAGGILVAIFGGWTAVGYSSTKDIETPKYTLIEKKKGYELREYAAYIRAEVTLEGEYRDTLYGGFRKVADYIFGNNTGSADIAMTAPVLQDQPAAPKSEKIAMTAPVLQDQPATSGKEGASKYTVAFVMPSQYTLETLPKPNNAEVQLRQVPAQRYAVMKFSWYATEARAQRKIKALLERMQADGLSPAGPAMVAQYDPPWTPPYMRKNEIHIPVN